MAVYLVIFAPVFPAVAYLSYATLAGKNAWRRLWPLGVITVNWMAFAVLPVIPDPLILATYIWSGFLLLGLCWKVGALNVVSIVALKRAWLRANKRNG